jgi:GT2 family glycosyltransferase/glycosyltransferase involved in cell wall biosynthesis
METVDIVIVNHNSTDFAVNAIESIKSSARDVVPNIVVADNASIDHPERLADRFPDIRLLLNRENLGYSKAINMALAGCRSPYVVVINPDTIVSSGFFSDVLKTFESDRNVGVAGPKILDPDGSIQGSARKFPTAWSYAFGRTSPLTKLYPNNSITRREFMCFDHNGDTPIPVDWVSGACMVIRRKAFEEVRGFDERFFLYWEDTDFCERIRNAGWEVVYDPKAEIKHIVGMSSRTKPLESIWHFHHSCYKLFEKHSKGPMRLLTPLVFWALALRCLYVIQLNLVNRCLLRRNRYPAVQLEKKQPVENRKIKILRIVSRLNVGGVSIHVATLTQKTNKERFETRLVSGARSPDEGDMGYLFQNTGTPVCVIPELQRAINPLKDLVAFLKIFKFIVRERPDIVDTHTAKAGAIGRLAALSYRMTGGRKVRLVHTFHGNVLEGYFGPTVTLLFKAIERLMAFFTDAVIAISQTQKDELVNSHRIAGPEKISIIKLGFDLRSFLNADKFKGSFRKSLLLDDDTILIGTVGRLVKIKNHRLFLNAAKLFLEHNGHLAVKFVIVGDGELRDRLERHAKNLGIGDKVIFCGWQKDIPRVYADLNILALTSLNEGTPVSIIEAMAASVPVITTSVGGTGDLLGRYEEKARGSNGFAVCRRGILCLNNNATAFAAGLQFLVDDENGCNTARVEKARDYVVQNYTEERLVGETEALYEHLAAIQRHKHAY